MKNIFKNIFLLIAMILINQNVIAQQTDSINKKRLYTIVAAESGAFCISLTGLYAAWYKGYPSSSFHWFDDSDEWLQMDKCGHAYSSYYFNTILTEGFRWTGMSNKKSVLWGSGLAFLFIGSIEVFDGFSAKWGASWTDLTANTSGIALYGVQQYFWEDQRIKLKYSFRKSSYAKYRPDALGNNFAEYLIKDYNGQTQWLSVNLKSFAKNSNIPKWLNIAIGYGGDGMVSGEEFVDPEVYPGPYFERYRQFYISPDIDLSRIDTKSKFWNTCLKVVNCLKVPLPAVEVGEGKVKGIWLGF
ncbi:MAG: hypothetical protein A2W91_19960 [Bacteroidetes bacterium GWF2_38_335]|nr:MAG: hypothetical protein A2W91_19960 [Bacteroidetes bacterium GWF2_38_335]OFY82004.1 MAG: hypothetical protein A2281_09960 [Bacteroidetes bacterium RIFOXYA12_FULL_38_20]HBS86495.1 DUF2279 domain-containing protein [Bacteroidales bacterium]